MDETRLYLKKWKYDKQVTVKLPQEIYDELVNYLQSYKKISFQDKTGISTLIRCIVWNWVDDLKKERKKTK